MIFNGIKLEDLGIIPQFANGILDLPKREGETQYDWGDVVEPLVSAEDIYFGTRQIVVDAFFDNRKGEIENAADTLRAITTTQTLETIYGNYQVRFDRLEEKKTYKTGKQLQLFFIELNPDLSGPLPTAAPSRSRVKIDGFDLFSNFGLLVESTELHEVSKLKASKQTAHKNNYLSVYREPQELRVRVNGIYASKAEMTTKISALNRLLAKEGIRFFEHKNKGYQCYITDGYKVDIKRKLVSLTINLKVMVDYNIDQLVQRIIDEVNIQVNPQSDLSVTDTEDPAFVKGKTTFKAANSAKLDDHEASYFAKDADLKAVRDLDLAARLEENTDF